jgi:DNA repair exonuclease SbcCD ATPase subunit
LEQALSAETKRRVDATTLLEERAKRQVAEMEERLRTQLLEDSKRLNERLDKIETELTRVDERWQRESFQQMDDIHKKADTFQDALEELQQQQDTDRKARLGREGRLLQQVEEHAKEFEDRWNKERNDRLEQVAGLEQHLQSQESTRFQEQEDFQQRVEQELEALQLELKEEVTERQAQDEEIVGALNRYTQQLQQSLSILSSD